MSRPVPYFYHFSASLLSWLRGSRHLSLSHAKPTVWCFKKRSHYVEITNVLRYLRPLSALFIHFAPNHAVNQYNSIWFVCLFSCGGQTVSVEIRHLSGRLSVRWMTDKWILGIWRNANCQGKIRYHTVRHKSHKEYRRITILTKRRDLINQRRKNTAFDHDAMKTPKTRGVLF